MNFASLILLASFATWISFFLLRLLFKSTQAQLKNLPLPPSPPALPWIGNLFSVPSGLEHLSYAKLGRELGSSIFLLKIFGSNVVVLNSAKAAADLMDKRSANYSDRVCLPMVGHPEGMNWSGFMTFLGYNDTWRMYRRMMNHWLNARSSVSFHDSQEKQARQLLGRLLCLPPVTSSKMLHQHFFRTMAATVFQTVYGYQVESDDDPFVLGAQETVVNFCKAQMPGNFLANFFPALFYVPNWMPFTEWKKTARKWRERKDLIVDTIYQWTKTHVAEGTAEPSMIHSLMDSKLTVALSESEKDERLKTLGITLYTGGTETTSSSLTSFIAAMILYPEVQAQAQAEIDSIIGPERLPTITDRNRLPYVNRLILECLRWQPVIPLGVPHLSIDEDEYMGFRIPKRTMIIGNIWAMSRDESAYPKPEDFDPDRYLDPKVPILPSFGWGRRGCPGSHYADASLFIAVASMLAAFRFIKTKDTNGIEITPKIECDENSAIFYPKPFNCIIECRSELHRGLILQSS